MVAIETGAVLARGRRFPEAFIPTCHVIKPREGYVLFHSKLGLRARNIDTCSSSG